MNNPEHLHRNDVNDLVLKYDNKRGYKVVFFSLPAFVDPDYGIIAALGYLTGIICSEDDSAKTRSKIRMVFEIGGTIALGAGFAGIGLRKLGQVKSLNEAAKMWIKSPRGIIYTTDAVAVGGGTAISEFSFERIKKSALNAAGWLLSFIPIDIIIEIFAYIFPKFHQFLATKCPWITAIGAGLLAISGIIGFFQSRREKYAYKCQRVFTDILDTLRTKFFIPTYGKEQQFEKWLENFERNNLIGLCFDLEKIPFFHFSGTIDIRRSRVFFKNLPGIPNLIYLPKKGEDDEKREYYVAALRELWRFFRCNQDADYIDTIDNYNEDEPYYNFDFRTMNKQLLRMYRGKREITDFKDWENDPHD